MSRLGWLKRAADIARQEECNAEGARLRAFENHAGTLPDDNDARAVTLLDGVCVAIRKARKDLEALERLEEMSEAARRHYLRMFP